MDSNLLFDLFVLVLQELGKLFHENVFFFYLLLQIIQKQQQNAQYGHRFGRFCLSILNLNITKISGMEIYQAKKPLFGFAVSRFEDRRKKKTFSIRLRVFRVSVIRNDFLISFAGTIVFLLHATDMPIQNQKTCSLSSDSMLSLNVVRLQSM